MLGSGKGSGLAAAGAGLLAWWCVSSSGEGHGLLVLLVQAITRQMVTVAGQIVHAASALCRRRTLVIRARMRPTMSPKRDKNSSSDRMVRI